MDCSCKPLQRSFFLPPPDEVAPRLLGKILVGGGGRGGGAELRARIVETEAYLGQGDTAAHAARGLTRRNAPLFGAPGHAYVYLIYGMHFCLNVSTCAAGTAGGVLFRAAAWLSPEAGLAGSLSGPGRLCAGMGITLEQNGSDLTGRGGLHLADDGWRPPEIAVTRRIGIRQAAELPLRFVIAGHPAASGPRGWR